MRGAVRACLVLGGSILAGCSKSPTAAGTPHTLTISVRDAGFTPALDSVSAGDTVTWTWQGSSAHDLTFQDTTGSVGAQVSGTGKRAFPSVGIYHYRCQLHSSSYSSGMVGTIAVY